VLDYKRIGNPDVRKPLDHVVAEEKAAEQGPVALVAHAHDPTLPVSAMDARAGPEAEKWEQAMLKEIGNLETMGTWELVELPQGRKAIGNRIVFARKKDAKNVVYEFKARLVAQGFGQVSGIDFSLDGTFAPVMRFETLHTMLAYTTVFGWKMRQFDVKEAYLHARLDKVIYMKQPQGFKDGTGQVCRLKRSLYGLKQAGNLWNKELDGALKDMGFRQLCSDYCGYVWEDGKGDFEILLIWVDDMMCFATSDTRLDIMQQDLESKFTIKSIGEPSMILGLNIHYHSSNHSISISQTAYIDTILDCFGLAQANHVSTPLDPSVDLDQVERIWRSGKEAPPQVDPKVRNGYAALTGSLMYLAVCTRPDIAFAVTKLCQFTANPRPKHWTAVKRVFRYLKGTRDHALTYGGKDAHLKSGEVNFFYDADYGGRWDRKSTSGYVITIAGGAVAWSLKKQNTVALSTAEAEYIAVTHVVKQVLWHRSLLQELKIHVPKMSTIFSDNQATIAIARNPEYHACTKHIDIAYHFLRDHVQSGVLNLVYIVTKKNLAYVFTKGLARAGHEEQREGLGVLVE